MHSEFRVSQSPKGYRVELCRNGEPYVTFLDGLTRERAERGARSLTALWGKMSTRRPRDTGAALADTTNGPQSSSNARVIED